MRTTTIVIGGGAAGMMAAIAAATRQEKVHLFEKNEKLGKKIYITGKGRCNVTNASDMDTLFQNVMTNRKFLYSAFYGFTNEDVMQLFCSCGCPLKVERGNRVFPESDKSSDIIDALRRKMQQLGVQVHLRREVKQLLLSEDADGNKRCSGVVLKGGQNWYADDVIVATGGLSYPSTGSTGDGYRFAREAGHTVTPLSPGLVPFTAGEEWIGMLQGLSLRNVEVTIREGKRELYRQFGEMLFTHYGVSGPILLSASSIVAKEIQTHPLTLQIDLKPALTQEQLDQRILRDFAAVQNRQLKNALGGLYPAKLIPVILRQSKVDGETMIHDLSREDRKRLLETTKNFRLTLTGLRDYNEAVITQGGVSVKEINPGTMESKKVRHLYFAGEVLDVDALTGGYNLQIAWSTGYAAGNGRITDGI